MNEEFQKSWKIDYLQFPEYTNENHGNGVFTFNDNNSILFEVNQVNSQWKNEGHISGQIALKRSVTRIIVT